MAKFVRNDTGTIHSVGDDFDVPEGWEEVTEDVARTENPDLLGETPEAAPGEPAADSAPVTPETPEV